MSAPPPRRRGATLRTLIVGGAVTLVLCTSLALAGLLLFATRMQQSLDAEARTLFAEQQTAAAIGREVERQLLDAAAYLSEPGPERLARFRERGERVYALERGYLFRPLSLEERLQVERVKELHQMLEVLAQAAFDARAGGDAPAVAARADALFAASEPVQQALDRFVDLREESYYRAQRRQAAVLQRVYVAAALTAGVLLVGILLAARVVHRRILAPVDALARAADRVGAGDLGVRVEPRTDDELSRLARRFNGMTEGLEQLQRELRGSEARYRQLVQLSPDAIIVHDGTGIRLGNPAATRLFGAADAAALDGCRLDALLAAHTRAADAPRLAAALAGSEGGAPVELTFQRLDGGVVDAELVAAPFDDGGRPASLVAIRDVTARRQAEATLRATEDRLRQAQKMETVGRLAGGIAHDFNNLLTIILVHSDLLLGSLPPDDERVGDVREVRTAGERATALTRQLLAFSRQQVLQLGPVDLGQVVREMTTWLRRLIASDVELRVELAPALPAVEADRGQVEQVLLNLALNARDAMPDGGRLTIRTARVELPPSPPGGDAGAPAGAFVSLQVIDTGVGMDAATRARAFEPFFTTKEVGRGTGLGLATVYGIVQQSGGHVRVESEPGRGSRFEVLLRPYVAPLSAAVPPPAAPAPRGGRETVLLAEDDAIVRGLAARVLASRGYTVLAARDGAEAERIADAHDGPIHLLVTDVVMPGISGRELAGRLVGRRAGLKVLFTSGYTEDEILRRGVMRGTHELLEKPYTPDSLATRVRQALDRGD